MRAEGIGGGGRIAEVTAEEPERVPHFCGLNNGESKEIIWFDLINWTAKFLRLKQNFEDFFLFSFFFSTEGRHVAGDDSL